MSSTVSDLYRRAFVTGASGGLGAAFAEMLLADGVPVWGTARERAKLAAITARHGGRFTPVRLDLADGAAAERAFLEMEQAAGGFDLVINNAGYGAFGAFAETDFAVWQAQLDAMLTATLRLAHAAQRGQRARGRGCLVNVSSLAVEFPLPYMSGYNVAKAGLSAFSESLLDENRGTNLIVIDFRPGDYRTAFNQAMHSTVPASSPQGSRLARAWQVLEANLAAAPAPERAAADLRRALLAGRRGTVRSGSFFQARVAAGFAKLAPASWRRYVAAKHFGQL
ncbi:MAG: SDR family NAD(P)-dependent oxidoreductase [Verrucomicrobia bacterium]|nr:SDR family NAD(P)-dependent oxidoreductase [Verrucomicrobiota bacterium]